jgi:hypothetical protein
MSDVIGGVRSVLRGAVAVGVLALVWLAAAATAAVGQTTSTATTPTTASTPTTGTASTSGGTASSHGSVIDLGHNGRIVFVVAVVGLFAALWFVLILQDRIRTNRRIDTLLEALIADAVRRPDDQRVSVDEIRALTRAASTRGAPGLTRTTIALGLLTLVGVALAALLVGDGGNASDLLKTVVTALTTALTTVIGFYFGTKATAEGVEQGGAPPGDGGPAKPSTRPRPPSIDSVEVQGTTATVSFSPPTGTGGPTITGYVVTVNPGGKMVTGATSPIVVTDLVAGNEYTFTVRATSATGDSVESAGKKVTAPPNAGG